MPLDNMRLIIFFQDQLIPIFDILTSQGSFVLYSLFNIRSFHSLKWYKIVVTENCGEKMLNIINQNRATNNDMIYHTFYAIL